MYKILQALDAPEGDVVVPTQLACDPVGGSTEQDFIRHDLVQAAVDLLLASLRVSVYAGADELVEPSARVRRVRAVLDELVEHLP